MDTIYATSSGALPAAIAIVRVSGPGALDVVRALAGALPPSRVATLRALHAPTDARLLDRGIVLVFPGPRTATGEDLAEFHVHGGRAVVAAVEAAIAQVAGTRAAEPGEFTRRALANGVIDLTAAEGLGDLLAAETESQRRAALRIAEGGLRAMIEAWSDRLVDLAARVEAQLDFSDEDDVATEAAAPLLEDIALMAEEVAVLLLAPPVERLRDGIRVVIAGPPNAGKSTLLNALTGRDVAIVSQISGTTRDRIEAPVTRAGVAYLLTDTAGLTDTPGDAVEQLGIARTRAAVRGADIVLWLGDGAAPITGAVRVHARADVPGRETAPAQCDVVLSAATGAGLADVWRLVAERAGALLPASDAVAINHRQRALLSSAVDSLHAAADPDLLIVAEEIRRALRIFDQVTGRSGTEDILDAVFSRFCIGK